MKKYLLPNEGNFYKADLHCHTVVSDGKNTASQMKDYYMAHGYSILAFTDHELLVEHSELSDENFLAITGYEYAFAAEGPWQETPNLELNFFARDPHNETHICFDPEHVYHGEKWRIKTLEYKGDIYKRVLTKESVQYVIDEAKANGFIVSLNHPAYSYITPEFFGDLKGLFAMEVFNQGSLYSYGEFNVQMYDQMLRRGQRISAIGTDDNHEAKIYDNDSDPRPWAHTMIKANELTYDCIIEALEKGDHYATQGPKIDELYVEDGVVHIKTSEAIVIAMVTKSRYCKVKQAKGGERIKEAEFELPNDEYMRFEVVDAYGRRANTRGYFLDEIE